jgi:uncharacterized membrane protein YeaQ/YmgE (transglycosylase-associated protein family)
MESRMFAYHSIIAWIVIGALSGWIAGLLVEGYGFGLFGNVALGILGAAIIGTLARLFGIQPYGWFAEIFAATLGALILLGLVGLIRRL